MSKIGKEALKLNNKKIKQSHNKWSKDLNRHLVKEDTEKANKYTKDVPRHISS